MNLDFTNNEGYIFDADLLTIRRTVEMFEGVEGHECSPFIRIARQLLDHIDATNPYEVAANAAAEAWDEGYEEGEADGNSSSAPSGKNPYRKESPDA